MKMAFPCLVPVGKSLIKHIYGEQYMGIKICKHKRFHKNAVMKEDIILGKTVQNLKIVMNQVIFVCSTKNACI